MNKQTFVVVAEPKPPPTITLHLPTEAQIRSESEISILPPKSSIKLHQNKKILGNMNNAMQEHSNFFIKSERTVIVMLGCAPPRRAAPPSSPIVDTRILIKPPLLPFVSPLSALAVSSERVVRSGMEISNLIAARSFVVYVSTHLLACNADGGGSHPPPFLRIPQQHQFRRTEFRVPKLQSLLWIDSSFSIH